MDGIAEDEEILTNEVVEDIEIGMLKIVYRIF